MKLIRASYPNESEYNPNESETKSNSYFNPYGHSEPRPERFFNPFESFSIRKSIQISIRMNPVPNRIDPIESDTKPNEADTNLNKLSFLLNPIHSARLAIRSNPFRINFQYEV